jgi:hypothetical protein
MIYACVKYHGENFLNNQYTLQKIKNRKVKQVLSGVGTSVGGK